MENGQIEGPREILARMMKAIPLPVVQRAARMVAGETGATTGTIMRGDIFAPGFRDNDDEIARLEALGREDGGIANHVPMTLSEADDSSRAWSAAVRAQLRAREDARRLPVQTEADPDVDNWPDAP